MLEFAPFPAAWIKLSVAMSSADDPLSMPEVQQLGRLNETLLIKEAQGTKLFRAQQNPDDMLHHGFLMDEVRAASWLWVLGAYEVFRRAKNRRHGVIGAPEFNRLNEAISEIRIVLAKREARGSNGKIRQLPAAILGADGAVGWAYWDRGGQRQLFFRAHFAALWIAAADSLLQAAKTTWPSE